MMPPSAQHVNDLPPAQVVQFLALAGVRGFTYLLFTGLNRLWTRPLTPFGRAFPLQAHTKA